MKILSLLTLAIVCLVSCQPEPDTNKLYDELVVTTSHDPQAAFGSYETYAIPTDTIGYVSQNSNSTFITAGQSTYPPVVLNAIRSNLEARGYTRVNKADDPDLGINVVVVEDLNVFQQVVYPDPYFYPGSIYSGYYGYNSWYYYPYVNTYAYQTGVLIIEIVDLRNRTPDNKVKVIWTAYLGDIYSTINLIDQTEAGIDQSFAQSPYVTTQ